MPFSRHSKIAFQFSGGKDSLAALYLLKDYWEHFTVYWLDTGDAVPEVVRVVEGIAAEVPKFCRIVGEQPYQIAKFGVPSDLLPARNAYLGVLSEEGKLKIRERGECCFNSLMLPMHRRMLLDGITCIIRGQKLTDKRKAPLRSGAIVQGIEYYFPLEDWDDEKVFTFLKEREIALPSYYALLEASPDCLHCTAYWDESRKQFLKTLHPEAWEIVQNRLHAIADSVRLSFNELETFLE
jgi:phosphoadenosine phosphosulfate reductase